MCNPDPLRMSAREETDRNGNLLYSIGVVVHRSRRGTRMAGSLAINQNDPGPTAGEGRSPTRAFF